MNTEKSPLAPIAGLVRDIPILVTQEDNLSHDTPDFTMPDLRPLGKTARAVHWLKRVQNDQGPCINQISICVFIGAHEVARDIIGDDPTSTAENRLAMLSKGQAGIRGIASALGAGYQLLEMGVEAPAADIRTHTSLDEHDCAKAIGFGMAAVNTTPDVLILGSAGVGSATAAAAIARGLYGGTSAYWAYGEDAGAQKRIEAVDQAVSTHRKCQGDPIKLLQAFGGHDLAGIFGAILAAGHSRIPVLLDGFVVCAAAAVLHTVNPNALDHCFAAHVSAEPAHGALLDRLGKRPLLDIGVGIGDGTGAAMTASIIRSAVAAYDEMIGASE